MNRELACDYQFYHRASKGSGDEGPPGPQESQNAPSAVYRPAPSAVGDATHLASTGQTPDGSQVSGGGNLLLQGVLSGTLLLEAAFRLQRLRTLLRNRRPKSGPPEGSSKRKKESATVPMAAHPKSWHFIACCRKPKEQQEPEQQGGVGISTPPAPPRAKWYHLCRRREAVAVKNGRDAHKHRQSSRGLENLSGVSGMHCSLDSSDQSQLENLELVEEVMVDRSTQTVWEDQSDAERQSSRADWNQSGVSSMHCSLVSDQSQLEDLKLDEELTVGSPKERVSRWENMGYTDSQSSRAVWNQSGDSVVSSMYCSLFSSSSYHSEVEDWKVDEDLMEIIHRHMEDREERANNQDEDVHFLAVLCACCKAAYKSGQESLDLPYSKGELIKAIVVVMEKSPVQAGPTILLLYAMAAVSCLSKIKPPTDPELESAILRFAVRGVIKVQAGHVHKQALALTVLSSSLLTCWRAGPGGSAAIIHWLSLFLQALHKLAADNLELMLRGFLSEAPTTQHLLSLLEHINIWILSRNAQERARASKQCASLLRFSVMMPDCDNSAELPSLGHHVAKLGICIMDSRKDVSRYAREGIYRLLEVLLHHKGQSSNDAADLWSRRWQEDERILAYLNTARVGEVFREIFNKDQKRSFLRTTLRAINHPLHRFKEAGLILLYSLFGKADALMGYEEEEIRRKIWRRLRQIKESKGLPEEIEGILKNQGDLLMDLGSAAKPTTLP
ncbi:uncharacterized protein LOC128332382 [Hemicordylus capensis]|uniref:uncharacterized protein LOC128332382 n=1 Tax=Hemicordylus capensis TaxID=884348 RepID=UPI002303B697|nr:uncharacterized protein LOC128332382 [Hemicordylus capensis]